MRKLKNIMVTGGAGFIGSNFIHYLFGISNSGTDFFNDADFTGTVVNVDCLTYAGNQDSLKDVEALHGGKRYFFEKVDICNSKEINRIFRQYDIDTVIHFAAETHVDRSISGPEVFIRTNVTGTFTLLETAKNYWQKADGSFSDEVLFHYISTDEVYGSLGKNGYFTETSPYNPSSPYSASKASGDLLTMSYYKTFGMPVTISHCTNNYGPFQFTEKFIPLMITNIQKKKELPVYGSGENIRDWIYVEDHNRGVWTIVKKSAAGEKWNLGGENEWQNNRLLNELIDITAEKLGYNKDEVRNTISFVEDRLGHDQRYAIDCSKAKKLLNWERMLSFEKGLEVTVQWYLKNQK